MGSTNWIDKLCYFYSLERRQGWDAEEQAGLGRDREGPWVRMVRAHRSIQDDL